MPDILFMMNNCEWQKNGSIHSSIHATREKNSVNFFLPIVEEVERLFSHANTKDENIPAISIQMLEQSLNGKWNEELDSRKRQINFIA